MFKRIGLLWLLVGMVWSAQPGWAAGRPENMAALTWLQTAQQADGGFTNGFAAGSDLGTTVEVILAGAAGGAPVATWASAAGATPLNYLRAQVEAGAASDANALSRVVMALLALGADPRDFGGVDLLAALLASQDAATGQFGASLFAHAYALLALHNAGAAIPPDAIALLEAQRTTEGAWALFGESDPDAADTNTTALAIQALVAGGRRDLAEGALPYLRRVQNADGGFPYQKPSAWGTDTDANSTAVVLQALLALGETPTAWAVSGVTPEDALLTLWDAESGGYLWQAGVPGANITATAQAVQALAGLTLARVDRAAELAGTALVPLDTLAGWLPLGLGLLGGLLVGGLWLKFRRR